MSKYIFKNKEEKNELYKFIFFVGKNFFNKIFETPDFTGVSGFINFLLN